MVVCYLFKEDVRQHWIKDFIFYFIFKGKWQVILIIRDLGGVKQELQDLKKDVNSSLAAFKASIDTKFDVISNRLNAIEEIFQRYVNDIITKELNESVMSIKDSITDALKEENFRLQQKVQHLENKLSDIEIAENKLEQYTRRNNIEIQGIPSTVRDNLLEDKVIDIFSQLNITISKSDIEDCHRLDKANPKNTIVRFVNRKFCNDALEKKKKLNQMLLSILVRT